MFSIAFSIHAHRASRAALWRLTEVGASVSTTECASATVCTGRVGTKPFDAELTSTSLAPGHGTSE
jgi:hypothetical protein